MQTPYGLAGSSWTIESGTMRLSVRIPPNTRAEVVLPVADATIVAMDGAPVGKNALASYLKSQGGSTAVTLPSGAYEFVFRSSGPR